MKNIKVYAVIAALVAVVCIQWQCSRDKTRKFDRDRKISEQNQRALVSEIGVEKTKSGLLESSRAAFVAKAGELESLNKRLSVELEETRGRVVTIIHTETVTEMQPVTMGNEIVNFPDSVYGLRFRSVSGDSGATWEIGGISRFRLANGKLSAGTTTIDRNRMTLDLTLGFREVGGNYEVFARSKSPNVVIGELDGALIIPRKPDLNQPVVKKKRFGIGVNAGYGIGLDLKPQPFIGLGIGWDAIRF